MYKKVIPAILFILLLITGNILAAPAVNDILNGIDQITELSSDGTAKVEITEQKAGEGVKVYQCIYYRHDEDDSFLMVFTAPEIEKGNGYLKKGDNFWMYRRNTRTFQHINRDESIAGTDASAEDFENKKLVEMYSPVTDADGNEKITETMLGKIPVYQFELKARIEDITYPKTIFWVRKDNFLPLKIESYSLNGTLMLTTYFLKYTDIDGKYIVVKQLIVDEFEKGNKTLVQIKNISIKDIDQNVFTKAYLESLSK